MIKTKIVSSLEKALYSDNLENFEAVKKISALKGERVSVQLLHKYFFTPEQYDWWNKRTVSATVTTEGELAKYATLRDVCNVGIDRPSLEYAPADDGNYITKSPALLPDVLRPLHYTNKICCTASSLMSVWVEINIPKNIKAGEHSLTIKLDSVSGSSEETLTVDIINAVMPEESIYMTQWFHADCLASYYNVKMWSKEHWRIIENFARVAVKNGINMLLTPILTPPLDTAVGGERPTTQLVAISCDNCKYTFDFTLLDKWVKMCDKIGIKYFEINHLFTQWGAEHAPKVMATVNGEYKKIFGWETDANGEEYLSFLRELLSSLIAHMKENGNDKRCFFHISDEPAKEHLETYKHHKDAIADILNGYTIMDALSNYEFYEMGVCETPIPSSNHIQPFIDNKAPNLWTYYCCSQTNYVSNRLIAMPSSRNRSIGYQMYKYNIVGFLHWGYNFYYNYLSGDLINPFLMQDGNAWVPAGDAFSVYPAQDGTAWESMRIIVFAEALQDLKVMRLAEKYCGKEEIVKIIDEVIGCDVTFDHCATNSRQILEIRERVNALLKKGLRKRK